MAVTQKTEVIGRLLDRITEISTLPSVALKITEIVQDPKAGARDLMQAVQADPALTMRVLRTINSAAYGVTVKVTNLQQAISFLGFSQIRNLALTASISSIFGQAASFGTYDRRGLWRHMIAVGIASQLIARRREMERADDIFTAGLLHDVGIILEDQYAHSQFENVLERVASGQKLIDAEREVLGFDHCLLGKTVAEKWKFPPLIRAAIGAHHNSSLYRGEERESVQCVHAANIICTLIGMSSIGSNALDCDAAVFRELGFSKVDIKVLAGDLDQAVKQNASLFQLL